MQSQIRARYAARAKVLKALAHPTRLFVVDELSTNGKRCVCELTEMVGADISTVSRHLAVLRSAGIIRDERHGAQIFYHITLNCVGNLLKCIESLIEKATQSQRELMRD